LKDLAKCSATLFALAVLTTAFVSDVSPAASANPQSKKARSFDMSWKPPDTDAPLTFLAPDEPCVVADVVKKAGERAVEIVDNLGKFDAVETTKRVILDANGFALVSNERNFDYTVEFIRGAGAFRISETRTALTPVEKNFVQDSALAAVVILLHPSHQADFEFGCEGKGDWQGHTSWVIHFAQRDKTPSRILSIRTDRGVYPVPLKGRAWVTTDGYQTVHLETNRQHPLQGVPLVVDAISADYAPVHFSSTNSDLWLPQKVVSYVQMQRQQTVTSHAYSKFQLFSVASSSVITVPKPPDIEVAPAPTGAGAPQPQSQPK
jgi:hypothetical protein